MAANKSSQNLKKPYFDPVDLKVNFPEMETKLLDHWYSTGIVDKYLKKNNDSKKYFSFIDGPITANNPMGVHHGWGRTYKDLWPRFYNMRGYKQRFQNGFDCQGLWVEVEVEKELGFGSKKDIEEFGVEKFVNLCKERVRKYSNIQTEQSKRLGYFADWDNSYYTLSDDNNYMIWQFLKTCHENGWIYKGNDSVPWCPRCETAISQHEMLTEDYKDVAHESVYMLFPIEDGKKEYLMVWTTTPWTIPANIAVAVDSKLDYVLCKLDDGKKYWVAKESAARVFDKVNYEVIKKYKGEKLVGMKYVGAFDHLPAVNKAASESELLHTVVATDDNIMPISTEEGTGMIHTAVSAGSEDFKLGKKLSLPMIPVIDDRAYYLDGFDSLSGQNAKKHPEIILDFMKDKGFVFKTENYKHRYPACWRCKTELVWKVTDEWYIAMDKPTVRMPNGKASKLTLRKRMIRVAKKIKWMPEFGLKRELDWLNNMHDWLISKKNRYWGLTLPIWECSKCGHFEVIGGKEELKSRVVDGWDKFVGKSPHKPQVDYLKIKCMQCGATVSRIEPVGNPWLDAGIVAYSTVSQNNRSSNFEPSDTKPLYLTNKSVWNKWVPADFITESFPGQFKNWFYSLIAMSTVLEDVEPTKNILGFASCLAEDGRAMHKSWGNSIEFNEGADKIGVDVMRWIYCRQDPSQNLLFGYTVADEVRRSFHLKLWNIYNFFITYANLNQWKPPKSGEGISLKDNLLDSWVVVRMRDTIVDVTNYMDSFDARQATQLIETLVNDISNWYVRRSRDRVSPSNNNKQNSDNFFIVMHLVLVNLSRLLAPFIPFITEEIYTNLTKQESVHLSPWWDDKAISYLGDWVGNEKDLQLLLSQMADIRNLVEYAHAARKVEMIPVRQPLNMITITSPNNRPDERLLDLLTYETNIKTVMWKKGKQLDVRLDTKLTPELEEEAKTRELVRKIQNERKNLGLSLKDTTKVVSEWLPKDKKQLEYLLRKTSSTEIKEGKELEVVRV